MSDYALLRQLATRANQLADGCNLHAEPGQPDNPWMVIGALRTLTADLVRQIESQEALEEKDRQRLKEHQTELRVMSEQRRQARNRSEREFGVRARGEI